MDNAKPFGTFWDGFSLATGIWMFIVVAIITLSYLLRLKCHLP